MFRMKTLTTWIGSRLGDHQRLFEGKIAQLEVRLEEWMNIHALKIIDNTLRSEEKLHLDQLYVRDDLKAELENQQNATLTVLSEASETLAKVTESLDAQNRSSAEMLVSFEKRMLAMESRLSDVVRVVAIELPREKQRADNAINRLTELAFAQVQSRATAPALQPVIHAVATPDRQPADFMSSLFDELPIGHEDGYDRNDLDLGNVYVEKNEVYELKESSGA